MLRVVLRRHWPLIISMSFLWIIVAILLNASLSNNQGHLVYALDDPYIHMAIAKNFAQHGVWGVTKYYFSSSSSSLLYPLILSLIFFLFGISEVVPLLLNIVFATATVCLIYVLLSRYHFHLFYVFIVLFSIIFFTPIPPLIFTGMEHVLHTLLTISFAYLSAKILSKGRFVNKELSFLVILAFLLTMTRYEGLFLIFVVGTLFIIRRRLFESFLIIISGLIPIAIYGIISMINGWYFLPNSLLIKSSVFMISSEDFTKFLNLFVTQILTEHILSFVLITIILLIIKFIRRKNIFWKEDTILLVIFISNLILHMLFARVGWFFRYEAYLVALGIFAIALAVHEYIPKRILLNRHSIPKYVIISFLIFVLISPLAIRGYVSLITTPMATTNIYQQQYQMGLFLREFYQGEAVAANDIGAINFLADIKCLDLWGLGNLEVTRAKRGGFYNTDYIYNLAKKENVKIAIVYDHWFTEYGGIPPQWIKVGEWKIQNNVVCGGDTVSFYAVDPEEEYRLIENLKTFSTKIPRNIEQSGKYIEKW